jgi:cell division protein FtsI (penicillin-binding protein 3)
MHEAMSTIANDGVRLRPQVVREIRDASGECIFPYRREEVGRVISSRTAQIMATLLQGVVSKEGTASSAAIPGYDVAGKTGTTQKLVEDVGPGGVVKLGANGKPKLVYSNKHHVASFVGFFPAHVAPGEPQVAISVIVDDASVPNGTAAGATVAAPSFKRLGEKLIPILDIKPANPSVRASGFAMNEGGRR